MLVESIGIVRPLRDQSREESEPFVSGLRLQHTDLLRELFQPVYRVALVGINHLGSVQNQATLESTQLCACFCAIKGVSRVPIAIDIHCGYRPLASFQNSEDPHREQNWRVIPGEDT